MTALLANARVASACRILFFAALTAALIYSLLPVLDPFEQWWDKLKHMAAFAALGVLAALGWRKTPLSRIAERLSFLGALIEVFQAIPALHRDCDWKDWVADTLAIVVVLALISASGMRDEGAGQTG